MMLLFCQTVLMVNLRVVTDDCACVCVCVCVCVYTGCLFTVVVISVVIL